MRTVDRDSSESTPLESGTFHVFSTDVDYSYLLGSKMGFRRQQLPRHTFYSVLTNSLTESMGWPNIKIQRTVVIITERCVSCFPPLILSVSQSRGTRGCRERGYNVSTSAGCGRGSSKTGQNWQLERGPSRQAAP
jgi:hypothetical protein